ncbi:response regulator transcription factor [Actinospongicola halichondriae]|uniref:helix-turn-helix transcriptional regulator n=1 Tax=Actinospongicola halichondriae TaxID=3236844 RepID=UPI003D3F9C81
MTLDDSDLRALFDATAVLAGDPVPGFDVVLELLRSLISCDSASFNDMTFATGDFRYVIVPPALEPLATRLAPVYARLASQHPLIAASMEQPHAGALRFCDVPGGDRVTETDLYREFYDPFGVRYQLVVELPAPPDVVVGYALNRSASAGEFSDRDVAVLDAVTAHLAMHHRQVVDRERTRAIATEADRDDGWAVLTVRSDGSVENATSSAVLSALAPDGRVPASVEALLPTVGDIARQDSGPHDVTVGGERWRCAVHSVALGPSVLLVRRLGEEIDDEAQLIDLGLTPRQTEAALALARTGGTNAQLARSLRIAEGTVKKHLEAVFRALGVDSRAAAVAALQQLTSR